MYATTLTNPPPPPDGLPEEADPDRPIGLWPAYYPCPHQDTDGTVTAIEELERGFRWHPVPAFRIRQEQMLSLIEDYLFIGGDKMSARDAAERLGVSRRTVHRYRAFLRSLTVTGRQAA